MRRGRAYALWSILVLGCSASGGEGGGSTVVPNQPGEPSAMGGSGGTDVFGNSGGPGSIFDPDDVGCRNGCAFTAAPILEEGISEADIAPFADPENFQAGSVCVLEPQLSTPTTPGALLPRNWLRPRFRWASSGNETLWEVRLRNESQPDELRAYTRDTQWILPASVWDLMGDIKTPVTVTIRGLGPGGALTGARGDFQIAPVDVGGSMVFWATTSSYVTREPVTSKLQGFTVGDEGVQETLNATNIATGNIPGEDGASPRGFYACGGATPRPTCAAEPNNPACCNPTGFEFGQVECVGCHVSTPDGKAVIFTDNWPWNKVAASIEDPVGALPPTVTAYAANLLKQPWLGMQALSPAHFDTAVGGERILITSYGLRPNPATQPYDPAPPPRHGLAWFDLAADNPLVPIPEEIPADPPLPGQTQNIYQVRDLRNTAIGAVKGRFWDVMNIAESSSRSAVTPTWSNDGVDIAYVSTDVTSSDGHPDWTANVADIHVVNYAAARSAAATAPAAVTPLPGASDPNFLEYYPEYSADDAFIAFTRAPNPSVASRCVPRQDANGVVIPCPTQDLGENPDGPYYNRNGEIFVIQRQGGTPIRLVANDPVSCTGETSRGIINSWPKWSPGQLQTDGTVRAHEADGNKYYFLIFSSARQYDGAFAVPTARLTPSISNKSSQLYMAGIMVDAQGNITTYPAVYLWNQNIVVDAQGQAVIQNTSNLTPAWDDFSIPSVPDPIIIPR